MPIYAKKIQPKGNPTFQNRDISIMGKTKDGALDASAIAVPDTVVICNGCNKNCYPEPVYGVYLGKRELERGQMYDCYCEHCLHEYFPKAKIVE